MLQNSLSLLYPEDWPHAPIGCPLENGLAARGVPLHFLRVRGEGTKQAGKHCNEETKYKDAKQCQEQQWQKQSNDSDVGEQARLAFSSCYKENGQCEQTAAGQNQRKYDLPENLAVVGAGIIDGGRMPGNHA